MKASEARDKGDQFVSVASIGKDTLRKVIDLEKSIEAEWDLMVKHFAMAYPAGTTIPGGMVLVDVLLRLRAVKERLQSIREVDPK